MCQQVHIQVTGYLERTYYLMTFVKLLSLHMTVNEYAGQHVCWEILGSGVVGQRIRNFKIAIPGVRLNDRAWSAGCHIAYQKKIREDGWSSLLNYYFRPTRTEFMKQIWAIR